MVEGSNGFATAGVDSVRYVSSHAETFRMELCSGSGVVEGAPVERSPQADTACTTLAGTGNRQDAT